MVLSYVLLLFGYTWHIGGIDNIYTILSGELFSWTVRHQVDKGVFFLTKVLTFDIRLGLMYFVVVFSALQLCALRSTTDSWRRRRMHMVFTRYVLSHTRDVAELAGGCIDMMNQISDVCNRLERLVLSTIVVEMVRCVPEKTWLIG